MKAHFYNTPGLDPWTAMAFDDWLLEGLKAGQGKLFLRLYDWASPAITIGYNQNPNRTVDFDLLTENIPVIRRLTGGRAIYHDSHEVTFSVAADLTVLPEPQRPLARTNELISSALVEALERSGIKTAWEQKSCSDFVKNNESTGRACFESISRYEIASEGAKIVGGAQRRIGDYFVHQGSLKINGVTACPAIGQKPKTAEELGFSGSRRFGMADLAENFAFCTGRIFGAEVFRADLAENEINELEKLVLALQKNPLSKRPLD